MPNKKPTNYIYDWKHLTLEQRIKIASCLDQNMKLINIADEIRKDPRTVSKEIKHHRQPIDNSGKRKFNNADNIPCKKVQRFPFVCNGCERRRHCIKDMYIYKPNQAYREYRDLLSNSRDGINLSPEELADLNSVISEGTRKGQSIYSIKEANKDVVTQSIKTLYNYVDRGVFEVSNLDLRNKVKMKKRRSKKYQYKRSEEEKSIYKNRSIADYFRYVRDRNISFPAQMDTVEGKKTNQKCFLTLHIPNIHFLFVFLLKDQTPDSVVKKLNDITNKIGVKNFLKIFPCILTDRGTEFEKISAMEIDPNSGERRTKIFYCDAYVSNQKGAIESNHRLLRFIVPKGTDIDFLDNSINNKVMSAINSYPRKELDGSSPIEMFTALYGEDILKVLGIKKLDFKDINLTPSLLFKKK